MNQNLFIMGANGNVGSTLVQQILEKADTDPRLHENPTRVIGLASISSYVHNPEGLPRDLCYDFSRRKDDDHRYDLDILLDLVKTKPSDGNMIFVDVTAAREPMRDFHIKVIEKTDYGLVTSNKNPLTMVNFADFVGLTKHVSRYGFSCAVMAGAEAVHRIKKFRDVNDGVTSIEGCFSGTLGYICSHLQAGERFSEIVREAKKQGYTEPHPADDLSGMDVAKKLLILARTAGLNVDMRDIIRFPFILEDYLGEKDVDRFMAKLPELDGNFAEQMKAAGEKGLTLRYVAKLDYEDGRPVLGVGPMFVARDSALGMLKGTLNKVVITTEEAYPASEPWTLEVPGAGLKVTAENVRGDLCDQIKKRVVNYHNGDNKE